MVYVVATQSEGSLDVVEEYFDTESERNAYLDKLTKSITVCGMTEYLDSWEENYVSESWE